MSAPGRAARPRAAPARAALGRAAAARALTVAGVASAAWLLACSAGGEDTTRRAGGLSARAADLPAARTPGAAPSGRADLPAAEAAAATRPSQELPEGVTPAMVRAGEAIYRGRGFCYTCHGAEGRGVAQLGADLTDTEWRHTDGSYTGIVERITRGVAAEASATGVPMPPRGGARLTDEDVRAVAAYVWTLSRGGS